MQAVDPYPKFLEYFMRFWSDWAVREWKCITICWKRLYQPINHTKRWFCRFGVIFPVQFGIMNVNWSRTSTLYVTSHNKYIIITRPSSSIRLSTYSLSLDVQVVWIKVAGMVRWAQETMLFNLRMPLLHLMYGEVKPECRLQKRMMYISPFLRAPICLFIDFFNTMQWILMCFTQRTTAVNSIIQPLRGFLVFINAFF